MLQDECCHSVLIGLIGMVYYVNGIIINGLLHGKSICTISFDDISAGG